MSLAVLTPMIGEGERERREQCRDDQEKTEENCGENV